MKGCLLSLLFLVLTGCMDLSCGRDSNDNAPNSNSCSGFGCVQGNEQGNGSDNKPEEPAWFTGNNAIRYCYDLAPEFGVDKYQVEYDLAVAFKTWSHYIISKDINEILQETFVQTRLSPYPDDWKKKIKPFAKKHKDKFTLATKSELMQNCDGSEDLKFYFGTNDTQTVAAKKAYYNPNAFSFKTTYDSKAGWGKGFVWFANKGEVDGTYPNWALTNRLRGFIIHELGHIYGNRHQDGTIMTGSISSLLASEQHTTQSQKEIEYRLTHIDHENELYQIAYSKKVHNYKGRISGCFLQVEQQNCQKKDEEAFNLLTGKSPQGIVTTQFYNGKLTLFDSGQQYDFTMSFDTSNPTITDWHKTFIVERTWDKEDHQYDINGMTFGIYSGTEFYLGELSSSSGVSIPVLIGRNGPIRIEYFQNGSRQNLFVPLIPGISETDILFP